MRFLGQQYHQINQLTIAVMIFGSSLLASAEPVQKAIGYGENPTLPQPNKSLIPTVGVAAAVGWKDGAMPIAQPGFKVNAFATALAHPRWVYVLPNGNVLVAQTNAPAKPDGGISIKGFFAQLFMKKAGAGVKTPNNIILLADKNGDGIAETRSVLLENLNSPFGMAYDNGVLYIADTDAILSVEYDGESSKISSVPKKMVDLPAGSINHHWTKNILLSDDKKSIYVTVGSNSNIAENGMNNEVNRAAILKVDLKTKQMAVYASGLRNPNGLAINPESKALWTVVNERDELGDDLVPDYMTSVKEHAFYGWPYSYYGQHVDDRVKPQKPDLVASAISPDYALGAHTASLGLTFYSHQQFPAAYRNGAFIGQHGSWNRSALSGYKVIFVPFKNGKPNGMPQDFLTGFLDKDGNASGRPVGVAVHQDGALLVADDVGNTIWRVSAN